MRLPNNYGTIYELKGHRKNPFAIRVSVKETLQDGTTKSKQKYIGYYPDKPSAMIALAEWNKTKTSILDPNITIQQVRELWYLNCTSNLAPSTLRNYEIFWRKCTPLYDLPIRNVRLVDLQTFFRGLALDYEYPTIREVKKVLNAIFDYAYKNDIVLKNYSSLIDMTQYQDSYKSKVPRRVYTHAEIQAINEFVEKNLPTCDGVPSNNIQIGMLIQCLLYTGLRINELLKLPRKNVHLDEEIPYISITDSKTDAGVRDIPIHDKILPVIKLYMGFSDNPNSCLFRSVNSAGISYTMFNQNTDRYASKIFDGIQTHTPHDTRHTFISALNLLPNVNLVVLETLVGHSLKGVTSRVYTHPTLADLKELLDRLPY